MLSISNIIVNIVHKVLKKSRFHYNINSSVSKDARIESGTSLYNSEIGDYSYCGYDCEFHSVVIGKFCSISNRVIIGGSQHPLHTISTSSLFFGEKDSIRQKISSKPKDNDLITRIGNDVWIGSDVLIKQGVSIGDGSVVGMGSVVTKDVAPYTIVAGNPATLIKRRFSENLSDDLILSRWWDYSIKDLSKAAAKGISPQEFINELKRNET